MEIIPRGIEVVVRAPAKLNLCLEVLGRRSDGYHELETVMQTISIYDELTFENAEGPTRLVTESPDVPHGADNLVVRAAEALCEHAGRTRGALIRLQKGIPVGAGLGGGSSDCAAALVALNRLWALDLPREALHALASRLGSDIAFFLHGGTALCRGRGEKVSPLENVPPLTYVVVCPALSVSTKEVYENFGLSLTTDSFNTKLLLEDLSKCGSSGTFPNFFNRLEAVTVELHKPLKLLARQMTDSGLERVTMTGSGSAFFGVTRGRKEARESIEKLKRLTVGKVFLAESVG